MVFGSSARRFDRCSIRTRTATRQADGVRSTAQNLLIIVCVLAVLSVPALATSGGSTSGTTESIAVSAQTHAPSGVDGGVLSVERTNESGPPAVVGDSEPSDPDRDGFYEDVNGDGLATVADVQALLANLESIPDNATGFDFAGGNDVDRADARELFRLVVSGGLDVDVDADGLSDGFERRIGTDPRDPDSDLAATTENESDDGVLDGRADFDHDGLRAQLELFAGSDPTANDTDADGLGDRYEASYERLSPTDSDTDSDGTEDSQWDPDGDGLQNADERDHGTDPFAADSDGDGLDDGAEIEFGSDPRLVDSDGDDLDDATEHELGSDPAAADSDSDGVSDNQETYTRQIEHTNSGTRVEVTGDGGTVGTVNVTTVEDGGALGQLAVSDVVRVTTGGTVDSATVTIPYDPSVVENTSKLSVIRSDAGADDLTVLDGRVDTENHTVTVQTEHFSVLAVTETSAQAGSTGDAITVTPDPVAVGEGVRVNASDVNVAGRSNTYRWAFGDGTTAGGELAAHAYDQPGRYTVTLSVSGGGRTETFTEVVSVEPQPNKPDTNQSERPDPGQWQTSSRGNASASVRGPNALDLRVFKCSRAKATKSLGDLDGTLSMSFDYEVAAEGWWEVPKVVVRSGNETVFESNDLKRKPYQTVAGSFDEQIPVDGEATVTFLVRPSQNCGQGDHGNTTLRIRNATFSMGDRTSGGDKPVTVSNHAPNASFTVDATSVTVGETVAVEANATDDGSIQRYEWSFGDGTSATGESGRHSYAGGGSYPITLTVVDDGGKTDTTTRIVTVESVDDGGETTDSDGDGIPDSAEERLKNRTESPDETVDSDSDGIADSVENGGVPVYTRRFSTEAAEGLGATDSGIVRFEVETDPEAADTDGDGLSDAAEIDFETTITDADGAERYRLVSLPNETDSDGDGLTDRTELEAEPALEPLAVDTDDDGIDDGLEKNGIPVVRFYNASESATVDRNGDGDPESLLTDPASPDTDGDGIDDGVEIGDETIESKRLGTFYQINSDPTDRNTDDGGVNDSVEYEYGSDPTKPEIIKATLVFNVYTLASQQDVKQARATDEIEFPSPATGPQLDRKTNLTFGGTANENQEQAWGIVADRVEITGKEGRSRAIVSTNLRLAVNGPANRYLDGRTITVEPTTRDSSDTAAVAAFGGTYDSRTPEQASITGNGDGGVSVATNAPKLMFLLEGGAVPSQEKLYYGGKVGLHVSGLGGTAFEKAADGTVAKVSHGYYVRAGGRYSDRLSNAMSRQAKRAQLFSALAGGPYGIGHLYRNYLLGAMKLTETEDYNRIKSRPEWYAAASLEGWSGFAHIVKLNRVRGANATPRVTVVKLQL